MKLTFIGAAHEVTGSCHYLEACGKHILIDCGLEQGPDLYENQEIPINPSMIDYILLTHAHIDHSGKIPLLVKNGFKGEIICTFATSDLCSIMLRDSAHIQESEAEWRNRKALRSGAPLYEPLYTVQDAMNAVALLAPIDYNQTIQLCEGIELRFTDVGHLLGSSCIEVWITEDGVSKKIVFSGDVGNIDQPIIKDPQHVDAADYLVIESTYGNRVHSTVKPDYIKDLTRVLRETFAKGGNVVIPSFAVGRTQELLSAIREIKQKRLVQGHDGWPVYLDSPLAEAATAVFMQCEPEYLDAETRNLLRQGINPLWSANLYLTESVEESKKINDDPRPKVILSASGMCDAGRIRHHLKHNLWKWENIILFAGYQAEGTLGRSLLNGAKTVRLFGEEISVSAEICVLHGTSGHADRDGLLQWVQAISRKPRVVFVNHGDEENCEAFRD
ncbi:MAG: MBL fold metallo-hydrolase, partial [Coprococcus comes]|nr:MBL fold metallo-hydrolase [Coprococcus comes]